MITERLKGDCADHLGRAVGVILGVLVAVIRSAHDSRRANARPNIILNIANLLCKLYLTVIRGTPMMVQLPVALSL